MQRRKNAYTRPNLVGLCCKSRLQRVIIKNRPTQCKNNVLLLFLHDFDGRIAVRKILYNLVFFSFFLKVDVPILTCIFFTFNWLNLTSEMHFVKFHPEVASCLLCRGKRKYAPLGMRLIWKYIRNYFLVYQLLSHFLSYLQNYKEFKAKILDLQPEKIWASIGYQKMYYFRLSPWGWECDRHKGL